VGQFPLAQPCGNRPTSVRGSGLSSQGSRCYAQSMLRPKKRPRDLNRLAAAIVDDATTDDLTETSEASELLRQSGAKGGRTRAEKLSPGRRSEIARRAALARWLGKKE
jgi:hypothetical protein